MKQRVIKYHGLINPELLTKKATHYNIKYGYYVRAFDEIPIAEILTGKHKGKLTIADMDNLIPIIF